MTISGAARRLLAQQQRQLPQLVSQQQQSRQPQQRHRVSFELFVPHHQLYPTKSAGKCRKFVLTSQFWSNAYLHQLDVFAKRELGCRAYLRYVDDFALFANDPKILWQWKRALIAKLAQLRLTMHERSAQVQPTSSGSPWLGFVIYPTHKRLKGRKLRHSTKRLNSRYAQWRNGTISFAEFDANIQSWINHARYADSWRLREKILQDFDIGNRLRPS